MRSTTELRDEILAAARAEFAQYGLAGARVDRIARAARASKERLYAHFGDKETLFREVFAADGAEFFRSVTLRPDAVAEFVGDIYDLACRRPEHVRMVTWAQLEGFTLDRPEFEGAPPDAQAVAAIEAAQADGYIDPAWDPTDLIVLLFGIGLAWAHLPHPDAVTDDPVVLATRRAAAVEAAARVVAHQR
ncbi:TetR/AcrR family transcriptional regulator [Mycobacterium sp. TNTM28]|uniref:TetR/AcrR family transcriptional regulator n=1 Tax=[Mycobacterium] fortunisiensis TaxID=2600579 RepID=A0ABS6KRH5_9MYCO|nr:TetR family transcriptional regulator [[Mycobacterium] fortunisiensis]MBU9766248.1 TetR/AcrR family transcriptional regulator [[Mycobacterium] fortunisiensis]